MGRQSLDANGIEANGLRKWGSAHRALTVLPVWLSPCFMLALVASAWMLHKTRIVT